MPKIKPSVPKSVRYIAWAHYHRGAYCGTTKEDAQNRAIIHYARSNWPREKMTIPVWSEMQCYGWQITRVVDNGVRPRPEKRKPRGPAVGRMSKVHPKYPKGDLR